MIKRTRLDRDTGSAKANHPGGEVTKNRTAGTDYGSLSNRDSRPHEALCCHPDTTLDMDRADDQTEMRVTDVMTSGT
ncbi:MAG TPA: hypothetical protein VIJ25_20940 [Methylococcales bacterium]